MTSSTTEEGIRSYLEKLGQQGKRVVDREAVQELKAQAKVERDVLKRVAILSELEREQEGRPVDLSDEEAFFAAEGKAWAEASDVTVGALQKVGVPDNVLQRAGFEVRPASRSGSRTATAGSGGGRTRAPALPLDQVAAVARKLGSGWKLAHLAEALDREPMTVRNYVTKLIENGTIVDLGEDPKHDGRGRAPKLYGMG